MQGKVGRQAGSQAGGKAAGSAGETDRERRKREDMIRLFRIQGLGVGSLSAPPTPASPLSPPLARAGAFSRASTC
jgi:hypothetical protein